MPILYTIGHSTHTLREFLDILHAYHITHLVDIRTIPQSRHVPWFNQHEFKKNLSKENIKYVHLSKLGGLRRASENSINTGWHNSSFRGFADYMQTDKFYEGLKELNNLFRKNNRIVMMCSEAVPWRCHRSLIADAELIRHIIVYDIMSKSTANLHKLTAFAVIDRKKRPMQVYYPKRTNED